MDGEFEVDADSASVYFYVQLNNGKMFIKKIKNESIILCKKRELSGSSIGIPYSFHAN